MLTVFEAPDDDKESVGSNRVLPAVVWLTGLSGAGKSTIAVQLQRRLRDRSRRAYVLDGDVLRTNLCRDLGYSRADRAENTRRVAAVAALLADAGIIPIVAVVSPFRRDREQARKTIGAGFIEVFVNAPLAACEVRDPKGLYRRARSGEIPDFTGISSPYEPPAHPELEIRTDQLTVEAAVDAIDGLLDRCAMVAGGAHASTVR